MIKVGCCGYPTSMKKYQENFNLVELNITFYRYPKTCAHTMWIETYKRGYNSVIE